jgi:2-desacetyl-2-hydroxyethyl bacteriochlorophyllide A dehydrogenase
MAPRGPGWPARGGMTLGIQGGRTMGETARQVVFPAKDVVEIEEVELREPGEGRVLIEMKSTLISTGTELAYLQGITAQIQAGTHKYPIVPGYSSAGEVVAVGPGVTSVKVGDRVCGSAKHATRIVVPEDAAVPIPDGVSFEEATFSTLSCVGMHGLRLSDPKLGEVIVVLGMGIVGQLALQFAALTGPRLLVAVDVSNERLAMIKGMGADVAINPTETDALAALKELTKGELADVVLDATGAPKGFNTALELAGNRGRIVAVGSTRGLVPNVDVYTHIHCKGLIIIGAHAGTHPLAETPYNKWTRPRNRLLALELMAKGKVHTKPMITHRFPFDDAKKAFQLLVEDRTRAVGVILEY